MPRQLPNILLILCALLIWNAVAPPPLPAAPERAVPPLDARPFGLNTHLATRYSDLGSMAVPADLVARSGAGWVREDIHWWRIQPIPDRWDWSFTDAALRELVRRKINVVGVLGHPPGWATPYDGDELGWVSFYPPEPERFAAFAATVVRRYGRYVHHWEIWNEPDNPLFWKPRPDPRAYADLLQHTSAAIRRIDPSARILLGGINPADTAFLHEVAEAGAWPAFDILAIHPYVNPATPEEGNIVAAADGVRALAERLGPRPIWATEVGWSSGPGDRDDLGVADEHDQASYLARALLLLWRSGVERIFWYTLKDDPGNPYGLVALGEGRADYRQLKPAFYAFQTLNEQLAGAEFVRLRDLFSRTTVLDFELFGGWLRGELPNGTMRPERAIQHGGRSAARLDYHFPTAGNDYVVFRRDRPAPLPGAPYALGLWVYGDSSGHILKLWLRDAEGELLQYSLGAVGPPGWRLLQAPLNGPVAPWDRMSPGNGRLDLPARIDAIVLDDAPDRLASDGAIYLDDLIAISGPEAYDLQLRKGDKTLDVLWAPTPVRASIGSLSAEAVLVERDGAHSTAAVARGRIALNLGPAPIYVHHRR